MKENTKYHNYRFIGKINVDEIQPWFDFATIKPWDEEDIPWVLENRVRREILISLSNGAKSFIELYDSINFSAKPLIIKKDEYDCHVSYQWTKETLENHLLNLEWYNLIEKRNEKYYLTFPILKLDSFTEIYKYVIKFSEAWIKVIKETRKEFEKLFIEIQKNFPVYEIVIEKAVEKLYKFLQNEKLLPQEPNLKIVWAEQLRKVKFEEWLEKNF
ncbi:MAG: hypothetical protein ACFE8E_09125 [Candidatus Hodarchaeota archaeon]